MCDTVLIPCNKDHGTEQAAGSGLLAVAVAAWKLCKATWWCASNFAIGVAVIAAVLYRTTRWGVRLAYRGYRWWATLPVNRGQQPVAAIADKPADQATTLTLADLRLKEPANS